jgi:hypothetical protein
MLGKQNSAAPGRGVTNVPLFFSFFLSSRATKEEALQVVGVRIPSYASISLTTGLAARSYSECACPVNPCQQTFAMLGLKMTAH